MPFQGDCHVLRIYPRALPVGYESDGLSARTYADLRANMPCKGNWSIAQRHRLGQINDNMVNKSPCKGNM